jgi:hypothetical protein
LFLFEHSEQPLLTLYRILFPLLRVGEFLFQGCDPLLVDLDNF